MKAGPDITAVIEPDGAKVIVSRPEEVQSGTGPGGTTTGYRVSLDGR